MADLTALLDLVGDDPDVLLNRGIAHQAGGRPDLALADYERALALPGADRPELEARSAECAAAG
ncbi:tetratricopeptide repeat protein [Kitasatospora arboriphila]